MNGWFPPSRVCCHRKPYPDCGPKPDRTCLSGRCWCNGSWPATQQILGAIAARFRFTVADLTKLDAKLISAVPEQVARRFNVVPVRQTDSYLEVATANPFDIDAEKMLAFATGREVRLLLGSPSKIREKLDELYRETDTVVSRLLEGHRRRLRGGADQGGRGQRRERGAGQPAPDPAAGGHDDRRWGNQPRQRHPRRADRGRRGGALPHRRGAAAGHEDPAQRRHPAGLAGEDHVGARHCRPAPAPGWSSPGLDQWRSHRPAGLDPPCLAGREGRHPDPESEGNLAQPRLAGYGR